MSLVRVGGVAPDSVDTEAFYGSVLGLRQSSLVI